MSALLVVAAGLGGSARASAQQPTVDRERFHLFVLAGQSNMAGRGVVEAQDSAVHPRVWMLDRDLRWVPAVDPVHFDKPIAGVGPGRSFGIAMAEADPTIHVGLVPTAVGGSSIRAWVPGGIHDETGAYPWDEAIVRATTAMEAGELKGVLWHQGESDSNDAAASQYAIHLTSLIERFRERLGRPDLPFLIGQLGRFDGRAWSEARVRIDAVHQAMGARLTRVGYVPAEGLTDNGDGIHFDAASAREFGRRYAAAYRDLVGREEGPPTEGPPAR